MDTRPERLLDEKRYQEGKNVHLSLTMSSSCDHSILPITAFRICRYLPLDIFYAMFCLPLMLTETETNSMLNKGIGMHFLILYHSNKKNTKMLLRWNFLLPTWRMKYVFVFLLIA